jgi:predicted Zn-dependent protease
MPAEVLLAKLRPDWHTLRQIWAQYRTMGGTQDLPHLLSYAENATREEVAKPKGMAPATVWYWQARLFADLSRDAEALECLRRALASDPHQYSIRYALAQALLAAQQFAEAEPHVRWCLARRPEEIGLRKALVTISKQRLASRNGFNVLRADVTPRWGSPPVGSSVPSGRQ